MNPHAVLGISASASPEEIKAAYRKLAMEHHPDRNGGSEESAKKFQEIQAAYDMLRGDKPQNSQQNAQAQQEHFHSMHDMFEQFFNRQNMGNPTLTTHFGITLEQAFTGCAASFNVNGKTVAVDVPPGIDNGQGMRIAGGSGQPNPNFPAGDLQIVIQIRPHAVFHRQGMTLITRMKIGLLDLLTGCAMSAPTITGGTVPFTVPENSKPDSSVTIPGEGMPVLHGGARGDLVVYFEVEYPTFTKKQLQSLRRMKKA
jgi:curved DNA-binding protein